MILIFHIFCEKSLEMRHGNLLDIWTMDKIADSESEGNCKLSDKIAKSFVLFQLLSTEHVWFWELLS